jgi:SAM-dependent methyltransferase
VTSQRPADSNLDGLVFLFLVSAAALFLELMLIRWISVELRVFAYLQSSVLVACLLGLGMGCFSAERSWNLNRLLFPLLILVVVVSFPALRDYFSRVTTGMAALGGFHVWGAGSYESFGLLKSGFMLFGVSAHTALILFLAWIVFIPLGQAIGRCLDSGIDPVKTYSVNIAGSFAGIALFTLLSALRLGPVVWSVVFSILFLAVAWRREKRRTALIGLAAVIAVSAWGQFGQGGDVLIWSPYQKLKGTIAKVTDPTNNTVFSYVGIDVNNTGYQVVLDLSKETVRRHPGIFDPALSGLSQYDIPLLLKPDAKRVLIVGAGSGNDAAGALRHGVEQVTSVEIDPAIIDMGRAYHRERPYSDRRVEIINDDARAIFASAKKTYDLIIFSLLDSHTAGPMTNARLDHYVYTNESLNRAKELLAPGGVMTLSFEADKPYLADRLNAALSDLHGEAPLAFRIPGSPQGPGGLFFAIGDQSRIDAALLGNTRLAAYIERRRQEFPLKFSGETRPITDDWPFLYLASPTVPPLFAVLAVIMVLIFLLCGRWTGILRHMTGWGFIEWHFFFLGAAFMLLEVSMITKSALAFGSTWIVNAVIISGIFAMILIANFLYAFYKRIPINLVFAALLLSCVGLYFFDLSEVSHLQLVARITVVALLTTVPMLFSGIVFMHSLDRTVNKSRALGANLFGALVGAMAQVLSFATGMKFLIMLVGILYLAAILITFLPKGKVGAAAQ